MPTHPADSAAHAAAKKKHYAVAFDNPTSFRKAADLLNQTGDFEGNHDLAFKCPDGIPRDVIFCSWASYRKLAAIAKEDRGFVFLSLTRRDTQHEFQFYTPPV